MQGVPSGARSGVRVVRDRARLRGTRLRPRRRSALRAGLIASVVLAGACGPTATLTPGGPTPGSGTPGQASPSASSGQMPSASVASAVGGNLPACLDDAAWRCGTVTAPVDRQAPSLGTIPIHFYVQPHTDATQPALEPVFVSPGGPGASIWRDHGYLPMADWQARHDTVLVEPRGVGESGLITCDALDAGVSSATDLRAATAACAAKLGAAADRYGSGDVALDVEDVRKTLGVTAFDYYAASYGTVVEQAYATRFPDRVHALVLDSGYAMDETLKSYFWGVDYPTAWIRVVGLLCSRDPSCASAYPDPATLLARLVQRVAKLPIRSATAPAPLDQATVDEAAVQAILASTGARKDLLQPAALLAAVSAALDHGDAKALLQLAVDHPVWAGGSDPSTFSNGDNAAAQCSDIDTPWARTDPIATRAATLQTALEALPPDTFAPFTRDGFAAGAAPILQLCLAWPAPHRFEPVIPTGAAHPDVPTLILSGDGDTQAPTEVARRLLTEFPKATFALVGGAGHDAAAPFYGACGGHLVGTFLDTLKADPNACLKPGS
jgi:pimeloyl-ACP methyl ester carboxylesterase